MAIFGSMAAGQTNDRKQAQAYYDEARTWHAELNSLVIDLMFLQRIAGIYGLKVTDPDESRELAALQDDLTVFLKQHVESYRERLQAHEQHLQKIVEDRMLLKDRELPYRHQDLQTATRKLRTEGFRLREELYAKVEALKLY